MYSNHKSHTLQEFRILPSVLSSDFPNPLFIHLPQNLLLPHILSFKIQAIIKRFCSS
jgi:hypothetical protein